MSEVIFSTFSDAVMAALASRSHEWMEWEIRECDEHHSNMKGGGIARKPSGLQYRKSQFVFISLSAASPKPGKMLHATERVDPATASAFDTVARLLAKASETPAFHFSPKQETPLAQKPYQTELVSHPEALFESIKTELIKTASKKTWSIDALARVFRTRNSRGFVGQKTETEWKIKCGGTIVFEGSVFDFEIFRNALTEL